MTNPSPVNVGQAKTEAYQILQKTGLSPQQLLEQRDRLRAILAEIIEADDAAIKSLSDLGMPPPPLASELTEKARALLDELKGT
jgi:hypothetical protein